MAITPDSYTTTSTGQVSGGGEKSVISGTPQPTASSQALQPSINAKQAQIDQFVKDNPSNFARSKQGLPPLSLQENAERTAQFRKLSEEKTALKNQQFDAQNPGLTTIIEKPNTTTNRNTTTFSTSSVDNDVEAPDSQDELLSQQEEERLDAQPGLVTGGNSRTRTVQVNTQGQIVAGSLQDTTTPSVSTAAPPPNETAPVQLAALNQNQITVLAPEPVVREAAIADADEVVRAPQPQSVIRTVTDVDLNNGPPQVAPSQVQPEVTIQPTAQDAIVQNQVTPTDVDPAAAAAEANQAQNASVLRAIGVPAPVAEGLANPTAADLGSQQFPNTPAPFVDDEAARQAATKQLLQEQQALQARFNQPSNGDWRFRIRLAPGSQYLYNEFNNGILAPLAASDGVIFPYTPSISTSYNANYEVTDLVHSNYRGQFYKNSYVGEISVTGTFTAQDTQEAEYLLAVIHFFKSVTKMFYGQDPQRGTPPPLVYLSGLGQYQFSNHPCVVQSFTYNLPTDVDYIRTQPNNYGNLLNKRNTGPNNSSKLTLNSVTDRLNNARDLLGRLLSKGGKPPPGPGVNNNVISTVYNTNNATYVPTKIDITVTLLPVQSRQLNSQLFSLKQFSNGELLKTGFW